MWLIELVNCPCYISIIQIWVGSATAGSQEIETYFENANCVGDFACNLVVGLRYKVRWNQRAYRSTKLLPSSHWTTFFQKAIL